MSTLASLQNQFQNFLFRGQGDFQKLIAGTEKVPAEIRLAIYGNAYQSRLVEALASNYPVLSIYLGTKIFEKIACDYISQVPSCYRSIRWFGDQLANFLKHHQEYNAFPHLAELAQFEWTQTLVFDAADSVILQVEEMAQIPTESWMNMKLRAHPSVNRINLAWNVVQIWQAVSDGQTPDEPVKNPSEIPWLLWRQNLINQFCSLPEDEAWALDAVLNELTFSEICEGLCQWKTEQEAGIHAASLLKGWIQSGLLAKGVLRISPKNVTNAVEVTSDSPIALF